MSEKEKKMSSNDIDVMKDNRIQNESMKIDNLGKINNIDDSSNIKNDSKIRSTSLEDNIRENAQKFHNQMDRFRPKKNNENYRDLMSALSRVCFVKNSGSREELLKRLDNLEKACEAYNEKYPITMYFTKTHHRKNIVNNILGFCNNSKSQVIKIYGEFKNNDENSQDRLGQIESGKIELTSYAKENAINNKIPGSFVEKNKNSINKKGVNLSM